MIKNCFYILVLTIILLGVSGCSDGGSGSDYRTGAIEAGLTGIYTSENPGELEKSFFLVPPSQTTYLRFVLNEKSVIGYVNPLGTTQVFDIGGNNIYSDIFFPVGGRLKTLSLDKGEYLFKIQNSVRENSSFTVFSRGLYLETSIAGTKGKLAVPGNSAELVKVLITKSRTFFSASSKSAYVTLYDLNFNELSERSLSVKKNIGKGEYILLIENYDSDLYSEVALDL